jgi:hypothetical protein
LLEQKILVGCSLGMVCLFVVFFVLGWKGI